MKKSFLNKEIFHFIFKFAIVHTVTYLIFGIIFMLLSKYFDVFMQDPILSVVMKPADALSVRLAAPTQIIRGALLALAVYPFRAVILGGKYGWLKHLKIFSKS